MKRTAKTALKLAVTALLLFLLYRKVDGRAFADALRGIRWGWVPPFFAIALANMWISSLRWSLLLRSDGVDIPVRKLFASHWIASFFNFFLPSNIGGDVYRIADVGRKSGSAMGSLASVFVDRLCGFLALSLMGFLPTPFWTMMVFLLMFSFSSHTYYPMEGSIGLAIAGETDNVGQTLGRIRSVAQVSYFVAATCVLVFFRNGFFRLCSFRNFFRNSFSNCLRSLYFFRNYRSFLGHFGKIPIIFRCGFVKYTLFPCGSKSRNIRSKLLFV